MQMINTGINQANSTKLTEFVALLNEVAVPKYFSKVELEDNLSDGSYNYALVKFYVDNTLFFEFRENKSNASGTIRIILPNTEYVITGNVNWMGTGFLITDNALVFFPGNYSNNNIIYSLSFIVCKTTDDKTMCMYTGSHTTLFTKYSNVQVQIGSSYLVQHVFGEPVVLDDKYDWFGGVTVNNDGITIAAALPTTSGHIARDVYQALNRSPYNIDYPFLFTQNGVSYCGIAYNNYVIKTT